VGAVFVAAAVVGFSFLPKPGRRRSEAAGERQAQAAEPRRREKGREELNLADFWF